MGKGNNGARETVGHEKQVDTRNRHGKQLDTETIRRGKQLGMGNSQTRETVRHGRQSGTGTGDS